MLEPLSKVKAKAKSRKDLFLRAQEELDERLEIEIERANNIGKGRKLTAREMAELVERSQVTIHNWGFKKFRDYYDLEAYLEKERRTEDLKRLRNNWNNQ